MRGDGRFSQRWSHIIVPLKDNCFMEHRDQFTTLVLIIFVEINRIFLQRVLLYIVYIFSVSM